MVDALVYESNETDDRSASSPQMASHDSLLLAGTDR